MFHVDPYRSIDDVLRLLNRILGDNLIETIEAGAFAGLEALLKL